jgi:hypothetical protein
MDGLASNTFHPCSIFTVSLIRRFLERPSGPRTQPWRCTFSGFHLRAVHTVGSSLLSPHLSWNQHVKPFSFAKHVSADLP